MRRLLFRDGVASGKFNEKLGITNCTGLPSISMIRVINNTFNETGCVEQRLLKSHTRRKSVTGVQENIQAVKNEVLSSPDVSKSHRRIAERLNMSSTSVYHILK